jgi:hypothetical protein
MGDAERGAFSREGKAFALWALPMRAPGFGLDLWSAFDVVE